MLIQPFTDKASCRRCGKSRFNPGTENQFYTILIGSVIPKALRRSYKTAIEMVYFWSRATELEEQIRNRVIELGL